MRAKATVSTLVVALSAASCTGTSVTNVTLPVGYHHAGVKRVVVRGPDDYYSKLGVAAVAKRIADYPRLFRLVASMEESELDMVIAGERGVAGTSRGFGLALGNVAISSGSGTMVASTDLHMSVYTREQGQIYENRVSIPRNPNIGMPAAAARLLSDYARGR